MQAVKPGEDYVLDLQSRGFSTGTTVFIMCDECKEDEEKRKAEEERKAAAEAERQALLATFREKQRKDLELRESLRRQQIIQENQRRKSTEGFVSHVPPLAASRRPSTNHAAYITS